MKKILLAICTIVCGINAQAQITLEKTFANEIFVIGELSGGAALNIIGGVSAALSGRSYYNYGAEHKLFCRVYQDSLMLGILVKTANDFDDHMEIALGRDFETTKQSFTDLVSWYDNSTKGQSVSFNDINGRRIQMNRNENNISISIIDDIDYKVIADNVSLTRANLIKGIKLLEDSENQRFVGSKLIELGLTSHPFVINNNIIHEKYEYGDLLMMKDSLKNQINNLKNDIKIAKKNNDDEKVSILKDSLKILRMEYQEVDYQLLP